MVSMVTSPQYVMGLQSPTKSLYAYLVISHPMHVKNNE